METSLTVLSLPNGLTIIRILFPHLFCSLSELSGLSAVHAFFGGSRTDHWMDTLPDGVEW
jgi:hypothetical protein